MRLPIYKIVQGDVRSGLKRLYEMGVRVDVIVSSPPYYAQRDYKVAGQIGHERTSQEYVEVMSEIFYEYCRPLLKSHGLVFLNLGDSYNGSNGAGSQGASSMGEYKEYGALIKNESEYKPRDLMNVPNRVYEALRQKGYFWRSTIIWAKTNGMPESISGVSWKRHRIKVSTGDTPEYLSEIEATGVGKTHWATRTKHGVEATYIECPGCDKCTPNGGYVLRWGSGRPVAKYELIGLLTQDRYYWDNEAVRTPYAESSIGRKEYPLGSFGGTENNGNRMSKQVDRDALDETFLGANLTNVWHLPTAQFREKHFATFPEALPELCIKAGSSEYGCCAECGAPYARVLDRVGKVMEGVNSRTADVNGFSESSALRGKGIQVYQTVGWKPTCGCNAEHQWAETNDGYDDYICGRCGAQPGTAEENEPCRVPAIVLDPFAGAGTTLMVANRLGRDAYGCELNTDYKEIAENRITRDAPLFAYASQLSFGGEDGN